MDIDRYVTGNDDDRIGRKIGHGQGALEAAHIRRQVGL